MALSFYHGGYFAFSLLLSFVVGVEVGTIASQKAALRAYDFYGEGLVVSSRRPNCTLTGEVLPCVGVWGCAQTICRAAQAPGASFAVVQYIARQSCTSDWDTQDIWEEVTQVGDMQTAFRLVVSSAALHLSAALVLAVIAIAELWERRRPEYVRHLRKIRGNRSRIWLAWLAFLSLFAAMKATLASVLLFAARASDPLPEAHDGDWTVSAKTAEVLRTGRFAPLAALFAETICLLFVFAKEAAWAYRSDSSLSSYDLQ